MRRLISIGLLGALLSGCGRHGHADESCEPRAVGADFADVYSSVSSAVVSIAPANSPSVSSTRGSLGAGLVVGDGQFIVTAAHVARGYGKYHVSYSDGSSSLAETVVTDPRTDLSLLKQERSRNPSRGSPLKMRKAPPLKVGEWVVAVGAPLGFGNSITVGLVSALGRKPEQIDLVMPGIDPNLDLIQTDAVIHAGNSGGPLIDAAGRIVGIVVAAFGVTQRVGFVVPIDAVEPLIAMATR